MKSLLKLLLLFWGLSNLNVINYSLLFFWCFSVISNVISYSLLLFWCLSVTLNVISYSLLLFWYVVVSCFH